MSIARPRWKEPEFSVGEIKRAGKIVRDCSAVDSDKTAALRVVDNWRAAHAYPLHVFYMNLRKNRRFDANITVAERLKRLDSIVAKLQREKNMNLYFMQDLGGCRMIVPTVDDVYHYSNSLKKSKILHELKKEYDYIKTPKTSGYRSLHLVYRFRSDTQSKEIYNRYNMLIELQFRTHLQHIWATAVETIGLFTNQSIKAGQGDEAIKRFFVLVSSLFAIRENCTVVPGTNEDVQELVSEIEILNDDHHILDMLRAITVAIRYGKQAVDKDGYYILQLNYTTQQLSMWFFNPSDVEKANAYYDTMEHSKGDQPLDIVLVRAESIRAVKDAYPNYFSDIGQFVQLIEEYLK